MFRKETATMKLYTPEAAGVSWPGGYEQSDHKGS